MYRCTLADLSLLPVKAIDSAVKGYRKWLQACVSVESGNFEYKDSDSYI